MAEQKAIRQFMGERPDAKQLRVWRKTLEERLRRMQAEHGGASDERQAELAPHVAELERHRGKLEDRQRLLKRIQSSQWETRIRYMVARRLQMQAMEKEAAGRAEGEEQE